MRAWILAGLVMCAACGGGGGGEAPPKTPEPAETVQPMSTAPAPAPIATDGASDETGTPPESGTGTGADTSTQCSGPPPGPDYVCAKNCGPPIARATDPDPGSSWVKKERVQNGKRFPCPICLPGNARILTATGEVEIDHMKAGDRVWSVGTDGKRVLRRVEHVFSMAVPPRHELAVIELADGRKVRASPGHPDRDGRAVGSFRVGDVLDGSQVRRIERVPYAGRTYDLVLEAGATDYFSEGVRLRSSLAQR